MSAFRSLSIAARAAPRVQCRIAQRASIHQSAVRLAGKETELNNDKRAENIEKAKQDMHQKRKTGDDHWHEELASESESIMKAEREEAGNVEEHIANLQKEAEKIAKK
ncbi:hypothetical protein GQ43DRAFT_433884 [Delitschia confertaspora ATCC 74209]|uniref:Uncharacterized protein n=1 Tax=Delitschia confertaspora ATCC 74209 TaxID=1513339 RepID=A0A9P4JGD1_9PLEO|nr:hypothetical protein GQ43DRAFT_433884 [Delitschia confertaspora ATCC 74209]